MLKKRLGINAIERDWSLDRKLARCFKIPPTLVIPEGCRKIGYHAFLETRNLKKVEIPGSVEEIKNGAFYYCLNAVIILRKPLIEFKKIGSYAFDGCKNKDVKEEIRT